MANSLHSLQESFQPFTAVPLRVETLQLAPRSKAIGRGTQGFPFVLGFSGRKHVDWCDSFVLSQAADAWRCTNQGEVVDEWWIDLLPWRLATLVWITWTMR